MFKKFINNLKIDGDNNLVIQIMMTNGECIVEKQKIDEFISNNPLIKKINKEIKALTKANNISNLNSLLEIEKIGEVEEMINYRERIGLFLEELLQNIEYYYDQKNYSKELSNSLNYLLKGKIEEAIEYLDSSMERSCDDINSHQLAVLNTVKSKLHYLRFDLVESKRHIELAIKQSPTWFIFNIAGGFYYSINEFSRSKKYYSLCFEVKHTLIQKAVTYNNISNLFSRKRQLKEAKNFLLKSLKINRNIILKDESCLEDLADTLYNLSHCEIDLLNIVSAIDYGEEALELFRRVALRKPKVLVRIAITLNVLGIAYKRKGNLGKAEELFLQQTKICEKLLKNSSINVEQIVKTYSFSLINLGMLYNRENKYEKAEANYKNALKILENLVFYSKEKYVSRLAEGHIHIAYLYTDMFLTEKAKVHLGFAMNIINNIDDDNKRYFSSEYYKGLLILGNCLLVHGNTAKAKKILNTALESLKQLPKPNQKFYKLEYADVYNQLGIVELELGNIDSSYDLHKKAISFARRGLKLFPNISRFLYVKYLNNYGLVLMDKSMTFKALMVYEEALAISKRLMKESKIAQLKDHSALLNNYSMVLGDIGRLEEAKRAAQRSLELRKSKVGFTNLLNDLDISSSYHRLGQLYREEKLFIQAKRTYKKGLSLIENHIELVPNKCLPLIALFNSSLGMIEKDLENLEAAETYLSKAIEVYKNNRDCFDKQKHFDLGVSLNALGEIALEQGDLNNAGIYFKDGLSYYDKKEFNSISDRGCKARIFLCLAVVYEKNEKIEKKLECFLKAKKGYEKLEQINPRLYRYSYALSVYWYGYYVLLDKNSKEGYEELRKAYSLLKKAKTKNKNDKIFYLSKCLQQLSLFSMTQKDFKLEECYSKELLKTIKRFENKKSEDYLYNYQFGTASLGRIKANFNFNDEAEDYLEQSLKAAVELVNLDKKHGQALVLIEFQFIWYYTFNKRNKENVLYFVEHIIPRLYAEENEENEDIKKSIIKILKDFDIDVKAFFDSLLAKYKKR